MAGEKNDREVVVAKAKEVGELTMKVSVDVSEALTGLKAVQREARKASQVLRELETMYESEGKRYYTRWNQSEDGDECFNIHEVCLSDIPTEYLRRELVKRGDLIDNYISGKLTEGCTLNDISKLPFMIHPNTGGDNE